MPIRPRSARASTTAAVIGFDKDAIGKTESTVTAGPPGRWSASVSVKTTVPWRATIAASIGERPVSN